MASQIEVRINELCQYTMATSEMDHLMQGIAKLAATNGRTARSVLSNAEELE